MHKGQNAVGVLLGQRMVSSEQGLEYVDDDLRQTQIHKERGLICIIIIYS